MIYEELNALSDRELKDMEDTLLLEREMDPQLHIRHIGGCFVLLVFSCVIWLVLTVVFSSRLVASLIKTQWNGIVSVIALFVSMGLAVYLSHFVWRKAGVETRFLIRNAVHYWPVTVYLAAGIYLALKG